MSNPDPAIVQSAEAKAFLRMVTEGFYDRSYIGLWLFEVIGREWDELRRWSDGALAEVHPQTCTWSIAVWEWVYGFESDEGMTLDARRRRILAKIIGTKPINPEVIRRGISTLSGISARVTDFTSPYAFSITIYPDIETTPDEAIPDDRIIRYVQEVKPAHLRVCIGIRVHRVFRCAIPIFQSGAAGSFFAPPPIGEDRVSATSVTVSDGVFVSDASAGMPPDAKRAFTRRTKGAGNIYCHTRTKSKRID